MVYIVPPFPSFYAVLFVFMLSACSNLGNIVRKCPDGDISWVDTLMINHIKYEADDEGLSEGTMEKGEKIGEVEYMLADHACSNHQLANGDAAYLPIGTEIFAIEGYHPDFRVIAGNRVFQVSENKSAMTISDLFDIDGKVVSMSYVSDYDGSHLSDFSDRETESFIDEFLQLQYVGYDQVYNKIISDNRVFLRVHLEDGSSFNIVYWPEENILNTGAYGTEKLKKIVKNKIEID